MLNEVAPWILSAKFVVGATTQAQFPQDERPQVAFFGRSNVGKSSLLAAIMGKKSLVKISSSPGKTRELNFFLVNEAFYFVDLPGIGYAKMSIKQRYVMGDMIREYVENCPQLRGIVYLVDMRHIGVQLDLETVEILRGLGKPVLVVGSKRDKLTQSEAAKAVKEIQAKFELPHPPICVSVLKRTSIEVLWNNLLEAVATEPS